MAIIGGAKRTHIQDQVDADRERPPYMALCLSGCKDKYGLSLLLAECWNPLDAGKLQEAHSNAHHRK